MNQKKLTQFICSTVAQTDVLETFNERFPTLIKIYSKLEHKEYLRYYPDLLLCLYDSESQQENPDYSKLEKYSNYLSDCGFENSSLFNGVYDFLATKFNNFNSTADKIDAIEYLIQEHEHKMELLEESIKNSANSYKKSTEEIYKLITPIVDYLYEKNSGKSLGELRFCIDAALQINKLKQSEVNAIGSYFAYFETYEDLLNLYRILGIGKISVPEALDYIRKNPIMDSDIFTCAKNKKETVQKISSILNISQQKAQEIYKQFAPILTFTTLELSEDEDTEAKSIILEIIRQYKLTNSQSFLSFYEKCTGKKTKKILSEDVFNFVQLFKYANNKDVLKEAKLKNTTATQYLTEVKQNYESRKQAIENYLTNSNNELFIAIGSLELYLKFQEEFDKNPNTQEVLEKITYAGSLNSDEFKERLKSFSDFEKYFDSKEETKQFLDKNKIKFDSFNENVIYKNACLAILDSIEKEKIEELSKLGFLRNSMSLLDSFVKDPLNLNLKEAMELILSKKVQTLSGFYSFINEFTQLDGLYDNIIQHLKTSPKEMTFKQYANLITTLNNATKAYGKACEINNENILNINLEEFINADLKNQETINNLLCAILGQNKDENAIQFLPDAKTNESKKYSKHRIVSEITDYINKPLDSYNNIKREFNLEEKLKGKIKQSEISQVISEVIDEKFIKLVNSTKWLKLQDGSIANIGLHARLRIIDRFALVEEGSLEKLYTKETQEKLKEIVNLIYCIVPTKIEVQSNRNNTIVTNANYQGNIIKAVFSNEGKLITAYEKF